MAAIITRTGKGAAITQSENDSNLDSLCGINEPQTGTTYTVVAADQNGTIEFSNSAPVVATLALISTIIAANDTSDFQVTLKNIGVGAVTVTPTTDTFDDGAATKSLAQYEWITIQSDGTQGKWNIISSSNASKVDGLDASQFLRSDITDTTTGNIIISNTLPSYNLYEADAGADEKSWKSLASGGIFSVVPYTDAGASGTAAFTITRSSNAIQVIKFNGVTFNIASTNFQIAGVAVPAAPTTIGTVGTSEMVSSDANGNVNFPDGKAIGDANGNEVIIVGTTASAVNEITVTNAAMGNGPTIEATGETDVDLNINAKGTGTVNVDITGDVTGFVNTLKQTVVDIGDWNMDTTQTIGFAHGLTMSKIRSVSCLIRNDANSFRSMLPFYISSSTGLEAVEMSSTNITIYRASAGAFDNTDYDSTSYNRGWVIIDHVV